MVSPIVLLEEAQVAGGYNTEFIGVCLRAIYSRYICDIVECITGIVAFKNSEC